MGFYNETMENDALAIAWRLVLLELTRDTLQQVVVIATEI